MHEELIIVSARTEERLNVYLITLRDFFSKTSASLTDIAFTLQRGRESFDERFAVIVKSKLELVNLLNHYLNSNEASPSIFRGGKKDAWKSSDLKSDEQKQAYNHKNLWLAAAWWTHHIEIDWEQLNHHTEARRISLPTYPFERKRYWVEREKLAPLDKAMKKEDLETGKQEIKDLETGELVATFYNKMAPYMRELLGTEDPHLIFAPLAERIDGFSWLLIYNEPEKHPEHAAIIASKQKESKQILYRGIDFENVHKVMDIGCGFSTDLIDLAIAHPHISGDGFTIASNQAEAGANRVRHKGLADRLHIHCNDSSKDPFPGLYDLVIGFEVFPHIEHKQKTFENIYRHLNQDGRILLADCVTNTVTEINMPDMAMFTSTSPQYSEVLSQVGLKLIECVDISVEIANFLDDPHFESNFAYLCSVNPVIRQFEQEYRGWYSFGQGIKKKVLRYLLLTIGKAEPGETMEELREYNQRQFDDPVSYRQASAELSVISEPPISSSQSLQFQTGLPQTEQEIPSTTNGITLELVEQTLIEITCRKMEMDPEQLNVTARFADYGVGSLQGVLLIDAINREFDLRLKIQVIYDYSSIRDLSQFLVTHYAQALTHKIKHSSLKHRASQEPGNVFVQRTTQPTKTDRTADKTAINTELIEQKLVKITSREMEMDHHQLDVAARFADYGVGSLQGVLLIDAINREFDLKLKIQTLYDYSSIRDLSQFLVARHGDVLNNRILTSKTEKTEKRDTSVQATAKKLAANQTATHHAAASQATPKTPASGCTTDVAVIGLSGRFPGADNPIEFWENLRQGKDSITEVPPSRWDVHKYYDSDPQKPDCSYSKWGGFLRDVDKFDPLFFNISPVEAEVIDPQQRLFLENCWHALEDAGYVGPRLDSIKCGVFAGVIYNDYKSLLYKHGITKNQGQVMLGNAHSILASRVAYFLNLRGPVMTIDTACSSSLMAIHLACKSLREGETDIMLAGGVTLYLSEQLFVEMSKAGMVSPTGKCRTFDDQADGLVVGEAVAVVALKRLDRAIADGDMIYGVIKGTGTNQDGKTNGITAPSGKSQSELELAVYQQYGIHPESISYVEAHGTGTKLGDPIEVEALTEAFRTYTSKQQYCALASVKSNIGHTSAAAGAVSLIKVLLALRHKMIPPTLHVETENTHNNFAESPFYVNKTLRHWRQNASYPRRAAINSFGFSGSNCHVVVEEYKAEVDPVRVSSGEPEDPVLIVLSARNEERLKDIAVNLYYYLDHVKNIDLFRIAYTLQVGRLAMEDRLCMIVWSYEELRETLRIYLEGRREQAHVYYGRVLEGGGSPSLYSGIQAKAGQSLTKLAQLWVEGVDIDWSALYSDSAPKIVSLPTYPFARERYWIPEESKGQNKRVQVIEERVAEEEKGEKKEEAQDLNGKKSYSFQKDISTDLEPVHEATEAYLKDILSTALKIPASKIQSSAPFEKYGIDSVMIASLNYELESHFGQLPKTLFFERKSLAELTQYFVEHHYTELPKKLNGASVERLSAPSNAIENSRLATVAKSQETGSALRQNNTNGGEDAKHPHYRPKVDPQETSEPVDEQPQHQYQDIAIIGISGRYPQADNLDAFWENLKTGKDCITEIPQDRWDYRKYYDPQKNKRGKSYCKWGGFINNVDRFDPLFFNIAPKEAQIMDPQERLFLQTAWETVEDSGYTRDSLGTETVGVFVGALYLEYQFLGVEATAKGQPMFLGYSLSSIANRVSYFFNFSGPSLAVDTMCSSSLTAIHLACKSIRNGDCDLALAGGVNLSLHPNKYLQLGQNGFAASDGRCHSFGAGGDGYVPGEGVGAILLKPLDRAIADEDHIYAVIKGSSLNHGGKTNGYTVPNPNAQGSLIKEVLDQANVSARTISYIEAHGTGTELGDPIEISGLMQAYQQDTQETQFCSIGSAKANIGHLEAAAGIAAVTKVVLQLKHQQLVPSIHSETVNPNIRFEQSPFYLQSKLEPWKNPVVRDGTIEKTYPLRAGISSFGAGGANAHLILEDYRQQENNGNQRAEDDGQPILILLSAKNESGLQEYARKLYDFIPSSSSPFVMYPSMQSIAYTLQVGREVMDERLALIASNPEDLREKLLQYSQRLEISEQCYRGSVQSIEPEMETLLHGETGTTFVEQLLRNQELAKLAALWTKGVNVDWQLLYSDHQPQRVPLPTYPFAQKRYWIPDVDSPVTLSQAALSQSFAPHPLLDGFDIQESVGTGAVFYKTLSDTDWLVNDHRVKGQPVVPGVGTLEIANAAFSLLQQHERYDMIRVVWLQPIAVTEMGKKINIVITQKDERFSFEVRSGETVHAQGEFALAKNSEGAEDTLLPIDDIKARCPRTIDKAVHYTSCREKGVDYGVHFQGLENVWGNDKEALGVLQLPTPCERDSKRYTLHPSLVDSALQAISGLFDPLQTNTSQPMLPYAVEKVEQIRPLPARGYAHVNVVDKSRYDVVFADEQGQVCLKLSDVVLRQLKDPLADFFYTPSWILQDHRHIPPIRSTNESILVVYSSPCLPLADTLINAHSSHNCFRFQLDSVSAKQGDTLWTVNADDPLACENCLLALMEKVGSSSLTIYFLAGYQTEGNKGDNIDLLEQSQQQGILSLFRLFKAITKYNLSDRLRLNVLTNRVFQIKPGEKNNPYTASLHGFTSSLAREYPQLDVSCIDISLDDFAVGIPEAERQTWVSPILSEPPHPQGEAVALRRGRRYVRKLLPITLPSVSKTPFRTKGVYFILGGAGGIGLELSRYLTETVEAKVILIGRRELDANKQTLIQTIASNGGEILYLTADATNLASMKSAVTQAQARYGKIHGVFHSALVLKDKTLENMDEATLRQALDVKVQGSVVLHKAFEGESLDFMMFFSSALSFAGNVGQANYAAGCTFKDAYAYSLMAQENYPVKVINWGYWGTVGIVASEDFNKKLAAAGLYSIQPEQGMESVYRLLSHPLNQVMSINANQKFLEGINVDLSYELAFSSAEMPSMLDAFMDRSLSGFEESEQTKRCFVELERLGLHLTLLCFHKAGVFKQSHEEYDQQQLATTLSITPEYSRLFDELLNILSRAGWIQIQGQRLISTAEIGSPSVQVALKDVEVEKNRLRSSYPEMEPHINLVWFCMCSCLEVMQGAIAGTDVMFPNSSMERVEGIYKGNSQVDHYNQAVACNIVAYVRHRISKLRANEKIKILEVGAGTGSTSTMVFDAVREYGDSLSYVYTDLSPGLINYGKRTFGKNNPFVDFKVLNIEQDINAQGYELFDFDIVIATNVFHATRRINHTLRHTKALLKPNGWLIINEGVKNLDFLTYTFGLLQGWWLYDDEMGRLPGGPTLSLAMWRNVLHEEGFVSVRSLNESSPAQLDFGQDVIIAESNGIVRRDRVSTQPLPSTPARSTPAKKANGEKPPSSKSQTKQPKSSSKSIDLKTYIEESIAENLVQALDVSPEDINVKKSLSDYGVDSITGVDLINKINETLQLQLRTTALFDHANIEGFADAILDEYGEQIKQTLEESLDDSDDSETSDASDAPESSTQASNEIEDSVETVEVSHTQVEKRIKAEPIETERIPSSSEPSGAVLPAPKTVEQAANPARQPLSAPYQAVVVIKPGFPEDLDVCAVQPTAPGESEVEIEVRAFSLNFADFLCMRGLYPNMPSYPFTPGSEVSGVVLRTGANVQRFQPGDEVIAIMSESMGGHSGLVVVPQESVVSKPSNLTHAEACAFPVVFLTMNHAFNLANVQPGEKVLIQTAAGGIGLIAVQLALSKGAEIYATAGSSAKLEYLKQKGVHHLINYRTEDFADRILALTNGQGVDVVFNTLSDEAIQKGLNSLAPGGRYIEIAMAGLKNSQQLDLSNLVDNQTFQSIDMSRLYTKRPQLLAEHLTVMAQTLADGTIVPTLSHTFPFDRVQEAYHCLQQRENIGKVVVTVPPQSTLPQQRLTDVAKPTVTDDSVTVSTNAVSTNGAGHVASTTSKIADRAIAIVGMSGRFPGASNVTEFWDNLANGIDCTTEIPKERWDINTHYDPNPQNLDKTYCRRGGFLADIDKFDALFFKISGREAELTDPQQRLFLEESWKALEDAGYANALIANSQCGVFVGADSGDYRFSMHDAGISYEPQSFWGNAGSLIAARISYFLNLKGPSITIDTACSSSLVAIHQACQSIRQGESDMAIAGGVYIGTTPHFHVVASSAGMLAPDGKCKTFDQKADGFVPGEGVGAVVLKSLDAARRDGDHIYGVILGSGCNQDGRTYGITAPSVASQSELEQAVYEKANIDPATIGYVEAHGTGTKLGDPIEVDALTQAFRRYTDRKGYCAIGSVKSNIGHAATAAGIVGFIKVLLCLQHRQLAPSINFEQRNEHIDFENSPFYVNQELKEWSVAPKETEETEETEGKRRAAISSFGFGGTNAHIVVEEYQEKGDRHRGAEHREDHTELILLSAKNHQQLKKVASNLYRRVVDTPTYALSDIAYTLQVGREAMETRLAFTVDTTETLIQTLSDFLADRSDDATVYLGDIKDSNPKTPTVTAVDQSTALANRELEQLAVWWVSGLTLDWTQLSRAINPQRVSLPTYPFSLDRYWFDSSALPELTVKESQRLEVEDSQSIKHYSFKQTLRPTDPLLAQHTIDGKPTVPAIGFLNMVLAQLQQMRPSQTAILEDLFWLMPLYVLAESFVRLVIEREQDTFTYQVINDEADPPTVYCRGRGYWLQTLESPAAMDISHLKRRMRKQAFPDDPYQASGPNRVSLGSLYQGATAAWAAGNEVLVAIALPVQREHHSLFHPAPFVAALLACRWFELAQEGTRIPFAVQKVERWGHGIQDNGTQSAYAYVVQREQNTLDVCILDALGNVLIRYSGLTLKLFSEATHLDKVFFKPVWQRLLQVNTASHEQRTSDTQRDNVATLLIYHEDHRLEGERWLTVDPNHSHDVCTVCISDRGDRPFDGLDEKLKQLSSPLGTICLIAASNERFQLPQNGIHSSAREPWYVMGMLALVKKLEQLGYAEKTLQWTVLTNGAYAVHPEDPIDPYAATIVGLATALAQEHRRWQINVCDRHPIFPSSGHPEISSFSPLSVAQNGQRQGLNVIVERSGSVYVRMLEPLALPRPPQHRLRHGGVYVLAGGAGHLGVILSRYLIQTYQANVVWLGRREQDEVINRKINTLSHFGPRPQYITLKQWTEPETSAVFNQIKAAKNCIHGVFNLVMVPQGIPMYSLSEEQFRAGSFDSKVQSALALYTVLKHEPLDFLVFFSSMQSFAQRLEFMSANMSSYVAGCMFQDAFTHVMNQQVAYPIKTINWGYWSRQERTDNERIYDYEAYLKKQGIYSLNAEEGMEALERILAHELEQIVVTKASDKILEHLGVPIENNSLIASLPDRSSMLNRLLTKAGKV